MPPGFFPNSPLRPSPPAPHPGSQPSPHGPQPQLMGTGQPFIGPWYTGGGPRGAVRMGMGNDFNGPPGNVPKKDVLEICGTKMSIFLMFVVLVNKACIPRHMKEKNNCFIRHTHTKLT